MSADDMIRRGDAEEAAHEADSLELAQHGAGLIAQRIAALPAVTVGVKPLVWHPENDGIGWCAECPTEPSLFYFAETVEQREEVEKTRAASILAALDLTPAPDAADDPECTDCGGSGVTYQTERHCSCQPAPDAVSVDAATAERQARSYADKPAPDAEVRPQGKLGYSMTDVDLLAHCGADGAKWAAEFRNTALRLGYSDMDEGWLIGWFCNAIMAGHDRQPAPDAAAIREAALREAMEAVRNEVLGDIPDNDEDRAYNLAIDHAVKAILALLPKGGA